MAWSNWTTTNATSVAIDNGIGTGLAATGSAPVTPGNTTTYTLTAQGPGGSVSAQVTVTVNSAPLPVSIDSFTATPTSITAGDSTILAWITTNASSVAIDNGVGQQLAIGSIAVSPGTTTTYTLTATGAGGTTATSNVTVTVNPAPPQGSVSISGLSSINRGDETSFTVTLTNTGSSTITGVDLSFSVNPTSLLKNVSPGNTVTVGNVAPASSVSQTWTAEGDGEGSGTITAEASSGGLTLDTMTQALTVIK